MHRRPAADDGQQEQEPYNKVRRITAAKESKWQRGDEAKRHIELPGLLQHYEKQSLFGRQEVMDTIERYIDNVRNGTNTDQNNRQKMMSCSGMKGIGRTSVLVKAVMLLGAKPHIKAHYFSFTNGTNLVNVFWRFLSNDSCLAEVFARTLLVQCSVPEKIASALDFECCIELLRSALGCDVDDTLLICVDGIANVKYHCMPGLKHKNLPVQTMSSLMREADRAKTKLAFIFAHIQQSALNEVTSESGRVVIPLPLPALPLDSWKQLLSLEWVTAAKRHPAIHHLILSCCGHPRALVDGLSAVQLDQPTMLGDGPNDYFLREARKTIAHHCKFYDQHSFMDETASKWFHPNCVLDLATLSRDGQLLELPGGVQMLHPIVLLCWAQQRSRSLPLANHLNQAYAVDAGLGPNTEKSLGPLMCHYEAVLRLALNKQATSLGSFYHGAEMHSALHAKQVVATVSGTLDVVVEVENFKDKRVTELLQIGYIVVSEDRVEGGVEYLAPYVEEGTKKLLVAAVQCKSVTRVKSWDNVIAELNAATKHLQSANMEFFSVIYTTTSDQVTIQKELPEDVVCYTASGLFSFTKKLGILRLHVMKLGTALKRQHPWLQAAKA